MDELARAPRHGPNYNALLHLLNDMQNNSNAWPFQQPVNKDEVLDYYDVIKEPMDLATMEEKHEKDLYPTPEDFIRDAKLIFDNCRKYNNESTPYAKAANRLERYMWQRIRDIPEWSVSSWHPCFMQRIITTDKPSASGRGIDRQVGGSVVRLFGSPVVRWPCSNLDCFFNSLVVFSGIGYGVWCMVCRIDKRGIWWARYTLFSYMRIE
jgi:hypothetical protein